MKNPVLIRTYIRRIYSIVLTSLRETFICCIAMWYTCYGWVKKKNNLNNTFKIGISIQLTFQAIQIYSIIQKYSVLYVIFSWGCLVFNVLKITWNSFSPETANGLMQNYDTVMRLLVWALRNDCTKHLRII